MPIEIFAKFSDSSRRVLIAAQKIADENNMGVNSEHILIALATVSDTYAYKILHQFTINVEQIRLILRLRGPESNLKAGLSAYARKILELAAAQAANFGNSRIDAEHLLLAITCLEDCLGYQIITRIGINPAQIRSNLIQLFTEIANLNDIMTKQFTEVTKTGQLIASPGHFHSEPEEKKSKNPALDYFATNLTELAKNKKLDPVVGRDQEINRVIQILARKTKNNPVLVGDPGVGKTAIVEGLALKIAAGEMPHLLQNKQIYTLDLTLVVAGTMYRGQFEERMKRIVTEVKQNSNIILFIDEIHTLAGSGNAEGSLDAANILKPALAKGDLRLIGATTAQEYRKFIERDAALERRLQIVQVLEPSTEDTFLILQGLRATYEDYHQVSITDEALKYCAKFANRYISNRFLPDKAIDLLDEAAAAARLKHGPAVKPPELATAEEHLSITLHEKEQAMKDHEAALVQEYQTKERILRDKVNRLTTIWQSQQQKPLVDHALIATIVSSWTGIPIHQMVGNEIERFINLESELKKYIIGQDDVLERVATALRRAKTNIGDPTKPVGSFLFLGPSGVGKTELARVLAKTIFGKDESLIKIDMSEYMERHTVSGLIGAPAGYIGYDDAGKLTETIRRNPYSVVLFDEIEKAHPEVLNIMLQILDDGYITDTKGRKIDFRHSIIILTSNIGLKELNLQAAIGFKAKNDDEKQRFLQEFESIKRSIEKRLKETLKPELLNRIDHVSVFRPLDPQTVLAIATLRLQEFARRLLEEGYILSFDRKLIRHIAQHGFDPANGARPIRRAIAEWVETPLAMHILKGRVEKGAPYRITITKNNRISLRASTNHAFAQVSDDLQTRIAHQIPSA